MQQETFFPQQVGFALVTLVPSEWVEVCRLRCPLQGGLRPRSAVTDSLSRLGNRLTAGHVDLFRSVASKASRGASPLGLCQLCRPGLGQGV